MGAEKRFRNGHGGHAVGMGPICHHRSVVDRHRGQHPDQVPVRKGEHQALLIAQTRPPGARPRWPPVCGRRLKPITIAIINVFNVFWNMIADVVLNHNKCGPDIGKF